MTSSTQGTIDLAAAALDSWYRAGDPPVLVLHGPEGAGKRTAVERFFDAAAGPHVQKVAVRIGRTEGAAFEHDVLTRICESLRPDLSPFRAHREDPDTDALDAVLSCAHFLSPSDAAWLYSTSLGESGQGTLADVAAGWAGVEHLAPLLPRIGGDPAVRAAAREIAAAAALGGQPL